MTKRDSTKVLWRVQVRKSRAHKWVNKGQWETRSGARGSARVFRDIEPCGDRYGYGFGNTRVLRVVKA